VSRSGNLVLSVRTGCFLFAVAAVCFALTPSEYSLKAAYLFNILRFTERSGTSATGDYVLATYSAGLIEGALTDLQGTPIRGRRLRIRTINTESELDGCDAVFVGRLTGRGSRILVRAQSTGILSIGNEAGFAASGGMAALVLESRRVVVEVNAQTLTAGGWRASSHLLEVARIVRNQAP